MAKTTRTREGWPDWVRSRMECVQCGRAGLHHEESPHSADTKFDAWVRKVWPDGRSMQTRLSFVIWCSGACELKWKHANRRSFEALPLDGHAHQARIRQEEKAWAAGLVG